NVQNAIRPFLGFTNVNFVDYGANSNYHALQARASRRFASRLTANASFVWAKAMDQVDTDTTAIGYYLDRRREWGPTGFDRERTFTFDYVYQLPDFGTKAGGGGLAKVALNGWEVSGVTRFWTGTPFTITSNGNPGTLGAGVRADYIGGSAYADDNAQSQISSRIRHLKPRTYFLDPPAFAPPAHAT